MTSNLMALLITVFLFVCAFFYVKWQDDKEFEEWFTHVKENATFQGFTKEQIDNFSESVWRNYFMMELSSEEAIKQYLKDNLF